MSHSTGRELALFDFDGTLTDAESFGPFLEYVVPRWRRWLVIALVAPVVLAYRRGWLGGVPTRAVLTFFCLGGYPVARFRRAAQSFCRQWVDAHLRPETLAQLRTHQHAGHRVVVVSGNFEWLLAPWCRAHGVELLASRLQVSGRRLSGRYLGPQCVGDHKAARLREHLDLEDFACVHAYGDTAEDAALLALAHRRTYRGEPVVQGRPLPA
ncbi:HAD family hydrolase [Oleiagrimonas sp. C23AA]|uniref:HAD family hydrolase n=1 Tax=Oleiagrimonas sp. C23AA TaxID=2719047 RepID=UPI00141E52A8|nr:HAD family hydrolase [Oleiagrimonas sp. C23AA]NII10507.1 HAD family hydrolase [Oleiagrimonas sp. C23AA]